MLAKGKDELVCDFAETYHIVSMDAMRALPVPLLATLASGLGDNSRIKRKLSGNTISLETLLMARTVDYLSMLCWMQSGAARNHKKRPESIESMLRKRKPKKKENSLMTFKSKEDFQRKWAELTGNGN